MYDICTIGHITSDTVVTKQSVTHMPGGTSFYFAKALRQLKSNQALVTALAQEDNYIVDALRSESIPVFALTSPHTVQFENIYEANQDFRKQYVRHKASPFTTDRMPEVKAAIYHLGPLLSDDIALDVLKGLSRKGIVSMDVQGYLRYVKNEKVLYRDWSDKKEALPYVHILKANEFEMEVITGTSNVREGARYLAGLGVREVIITLGSKGSVVYADGRFYRIPAFPPVAVVDATGSGDTYMAGYLSKRVKGASIQKAGEFGAAMATLKIAGSGPFSQSREEIENLLTMNKLSKLAEPS
jgi:sugar/nucleoside kinase (ribokinase family)